MVRSVILALILLSACGQKSNRAPALGSAHAGPATLNIRKDIPLQSPVLATVKHGERLEIVQRRRRFIKVRTARGIEGWTDEHLLLAPQELDTLRAFESDVKEMPSQGVATTYELLNVHIEPDRRSPSFIQLKEGDKFDVIAHRLAPRVPPPRKPLLPVAAKDRPPARKKKPRDSGRVPPPPRPAPPPPPPDWMELSRTPPEILAARAAAQQPKPVPMEDWSLIRTRRSESGWVLTRRLFMAIPDEVAQYAEGHRITSYFSLGEVRDDEKVKHNWLWTTLGQSAAPYDFDSFRVFIWSLRRHRYETAYIERNLKGYFPVRMEKVAYGAPSSTAGAPAASNIYPGFSVCVDKKDGARVRRSYAFLTNIVRFAGEKPCEVAPIEDPQVPIETFVASAEQPASSHESRSMFARVKGRLGELRKRWFGR